jgi:ATP-dependent metalloprotease
VTSGATDDLRQATEMARHMVMQCGLNEAVGPVYVADDKALSEQSRQQIDAEVRSMLVEARERVRTLLTDKLQDLHSLAGALLDRETLTSAEIHDVLAGGGAKGSSSADRDEALAPAGMVAQPEAAAATAGRARG